MRPAQVLDVQASLIERVKTNEYIRYVQYWMAHRDSLDEEDLERAVGKVRRNAELFCASEANRLQAAYPYLVAAEMNPVISWAAHQLEDDEGFRFDHLPTPVGFAYFAQPQVIIDRWGQEIKHRAVSWQVVSGKLLVTQYSSAHDQDEISQAMAAQGTPLKRLTDLTGTMLIDHIMVYSEGRPVGSMHTYTASIEEVKQWEPLNWHPEKMPENSFRSLVAFWKLLGQTLTSVDDHEAERAFRRRAIRRGLPPRVTVITLRRTEASTRREGETVVAWSHRWLVRGFWAWRRCGPTHPLAEPYEKGWRARVWIDPYVKGPEDKPLRQSEKVFHVAR